MVNINTNLQSLLVQSNLSQSTNALNRAIERMTTGFKINHASDNAAGYSIAQNMASKLSSYDVAADNITMGLDLVSTAQDSIALMHQHAGRIRDLITQAMNGTYGEQSQKAIASEINARIAEINRLCETTEYNGIQLLKNVTVDSLENLPKAGANGFIDQTVSQVDYTDDEVALMTSVSDVTGDYTSGTAYKISTVEELQKLSTDVTKKKATEGAIFVLADDLNLSEVENFTPIGRNAVCRFYGTFNGNGHTISNMKINTPGYQGLFGYVTGATIKNVNLENVNINVNGNGTIGALVGLATDNSEISNCSASGNVSTTSGNVGGLIGNLSGSITNCYSDINVTNTNGTSGTGGLIGTLSSGGIIDSCYATGDISGSANTGGLVGFLRSESEITNSFAEADVSGATATGGLVGAMSGTEINLDTCYSSGGVYGTNATGGLVGAMSGTKLTIDTCCSSGSVYGSDITGGLVGKVGTTGTADGSAEIKNSISRSTINADKDTVGSFIGLFQEKTIYPPDYSGSHGDSFEYTGALTVSNCKSLDVHGMDMISGAYDYVFNLDGTGDYIKNESYNLNPILSQISTIDIAIKQINLQVGINGGESDTITLSTGLAYSLSNIVVNDKVSSIAYDIIDNFFDTLSDKLTELGAVSNSLDSALESTTVAMENITSSLSTIRDADIAKESSAYIKAQILQQAAATLLATANQTPAIALQLL